MNAESPAAAIPDLSSIGKPICIASHERSGTHLTMDLLRRHFPACRPRLRPLESLHHLYLSLDRFGAGTHNPVTSDEAIRLLKKARRPSLKTHAMPDWREIAPGSRPLVQAIVERSDVLYCVRDGREVMCSMWVWMQGFSAAAGAPFSEFLRQERDGLSRPAYWARHALAWTGRPGVTVVRFEDTMKDPEQMVRFLGETLGLPRAERVRRPALPPPIKGVAASWMARLTGNHASTNIHSGARKPPKRSEAFSAADLAFFDAEAGGALDALGYLRE